MHLVFDFVVLRFDFDYILFIYLFIYLFIFDIYTYVACLKFVMLFLVKLNEARDFRLELFFIWHHKSNTLIDLRTFRNIFMHNKCSCFAGTLVIFSVWLYYCLTGLALVGTCRTLTLIYTLLAAYKLNETGKLLTF